MVLRRSLGSLVLYFLPLNSKWAGEDPVEECGVDPICPKISLKFLPPVVSFFLGSLQNLGKVGHELFYSAVSPRS